MMVMSGIEVGNYQQAVDIIKEQFDAMQKAIFLMKQLNRQRLSSKISCSKPLIRLMEQRNTYISMPSCQQGEPRFLLEALDRVTKEDIIKVGQKIEWDTTYFLKGTEGAS